MSHKRISQVATTITLLLISISLFPQANKVPNLKLYDYDPLHFGFILAANQMGFVLKTNEDIHQMYFKGSQLPQFDLGVADVDSASVYGIQAVPHLGFTVGIVGDKNIGEYFNLRFIPSLSFGSRDLQYDTRLYKKDFDGSDTTISRVINQKINSTFVDFPLYLKYKSKRAYNMRAYIFTGIKFSFDLASQANKTEENNYEPKLYRTDSNFVLGTGLDFYMNWFKFGVELSMSYGMKDMLLRENNLYTEGIESLRSKIFMLTFTFE
ncbi:MAG: PorT family protein [Bacteroidales bacterium]|nr:PorT family protein [Bacteroidales bacterium]